MFVWNALYIYYLIYSCQNHNITHSTAVRLGATAAALRHVHGAVRNRERSEERIGNNMRTRLKLFNSRWRPMIGYAAIALLKYQLICFSRLSNRRFSRRFELRTKPPPRPAPPTVHNTNIPPQTLHRQHHNKTKDNTETEKQDIPDVPEVLSRRTTTALHSRGADERLGVLALCLGSSEDTLGSETACFGQTAAAEDPYLQPQNST